jgi:Fis family transcriptional regulator
LQHRKKYESKSEASRENELTSTVRKVMRQYFKDLDGEKASGIYDMVVLAVEKPMLEVVMFQAQGNQTRAAELLGMNRNTLRKKLHQHGLD